MDASMHHPFPAGTNSPAAAGQRPAAAAFVTPFARALSVLAAFTPGERWLCNGELARRTGLPASTVTRMTHTLTTLGYLRCAPDTRQFCLAPSALALGYRAAADAETHRTANEHMQAFAERHHVHVHLSTRDRLDLVVIESCRTSALPSALQPGVGTRLELASCAAVWALLACLPEAERDYLLRSAGHRPRRAYCEPGRLHRRSSEAIGQVRTGGSCVAPGESGQPMTMVAAPLTVEGQAPLAVSCLGPATLMGRARSVREIGPALVRMAREIQRSQGRP